MTDQIPQVTVTTARRSVWDRISVVWLVPLAALLIALGVAWTAWVDRGPTIEITFDDAAGIAVNSTELRFRNVAVGKVERLRFTENLENVIVSVRLDPEVAPYVDDSSQFWVVRPQVNSQGVTGLETVLSGVFIEGTWDSVPTATVYEHIGENIAPLMPSNQEGLRIILKSTDGALTTAMPLMFKGVPIGRIGDARVAEDGLSVEADAVVFAPYDRLVRKDTVFWNASGFSFSIGSGGATISYASLVSLLIGGGTFDTFIAGSPPAENGDVFRIFLYQADAKASLFTRNNAPMLNLSTVFEGDFAGLSTGAAVELNGLRIGDVTGLNGLIDPDRFGNEDIRLVTVLSIQPARLGLEGADAPQRAQDYIAAMVEDGLRARLATASLLTGGLKVQLVTLPDAPPATLDTGAQPFPEIPAVASQITDITTTAQGTLSRLNDLPIEDLLNSAISFMDNAAMLVGSPEVQSVPKEVSGLIADMRGVVGSDAVQAVPAQLTAVLSEIEGTVTDLRAILAAIEAQDAVGRLLATVDTLQGAATRASAALDGVPVLIDRITGIATQVETLPLDDLVARAGDILASVDALIASDEVKAMPAAVAASLEQLRTILTDVRSNGVIANANAVLTSAREAADQITAVATQANTAMVGVPALIDRITGVAAQVQALPLGNLVSRAGEILASVDALLASDEVKALPGNVAASLEQLRAVLADVQTNGVIANANEVLVSARAAADEITAVAAQANTAMEGVPALIDEITALTARASDLPLAELVDQATALTASADAFMSSEGLQSLPADLSAALADLQQVLTDVREGGVIENANSTLASAAEAADQIALAAAELPGMIDRVNALLNSTATAVTGFNETSAVVRDARDAMREVSRAAEAVAQLARTIERNPNALIFGR
jgi:paraquat-inducible protein B